MKRVELMEKIDFKKELKYLYKPPSREVAMVYVPTMNFLMGDDESGNITKST
jgi:hypothetical protein